MAKVEYKRIWDNAAKVRHLVDSLIKTMPEVFPRGIQDGYQLSGHLEPISVGAKRDGTGSVE